MEYRDFDEEFGGSSYFEKVTEREKDKTSQKVVSGEKEIEGSITIVSESERVKKRDKERER